MGQRYLDCAQGQFGTMGMMGGISMLLLWIVIIVGVVLLTKWLVEQSGTQSKEKSALDILKERYTKGEIDKGEFEAKKKDLS